MGRELGEGSPSPVNPCGSPKRSSTGQRNCSLPSSSSLPWESLNKCITKLPAGKIARFYQSYKKECKHKEFQNSGGVLYSWGTSSLLCLPLSVRRSLTSPAPLLYLLDQMFIRSHLPPHLVPRPAQGALGSNLQRICLHPSFRPGAGNGSVLESR